VEVSVNWYAITTMAGSSFVLTGTEIIPDPKPDPKPNPNGEISLADFGYVQALYNGFRVTKTVGAAQTLLMEVLKTDQNNAAKKAYQYVSTLMASGKSQAESIASLSKSFGLDLTK
jgi:hypothetical protein